MANIGDNITLPLTIIGNGSGNIRPPEGEQWKIAAINYSRKITLKIENVEDGTKTIVIGDFDAESSTIGGRLVQDFYITYNQYISITNRSISSNDILPEGVRVA